MKLRESIPARRRSGFTLIEIAAVLILLGVLAVGAVSVIPQSDATLAGEADTLASHLRYAQIRAQAAAVEPPRLQTGDVFQWRLRFIPNTQTYELGPVSGAGFTPAIIPGAGGTQRTLTAGVTAAAGSVTDVRFDSWGRPVNDAGAPLGDQPFILTEGGQNATITIRAGTGLIP